MYSCVYIPAQNVIPWIRSDDLENKIKELSEMLQQSM